MRTTIDAAGRVVVPKLIRDELVLRAGQEVEISIRDGRIEIEPVTTPLRLVEREGVLVAEADTPLPPLTAEEVRDALERARR
ncbi:MAG: AbrB/MazE/SpoVT family DNA-binding domain-containing protein [Actinobacteria bacterium]|nr:AbrB/MazE/SpoVT family DNA-binding domain-containing protein [Actinomycetota bacterium]